MYSLSHVFVVSFNNYHSVCVTVLPVGEVGPVGYTKSVSNTETSVPKAFIRVEWIRCGLLKQEHFYAYNHSLLNQKNLA